MLMPKKVKYRKQQRGRMAGKAWRASDVSFGDYGLKALEPCWLTDRQIEAARVAMTRFIARGGKIWVHVFPDKPITTKPQETRMGKGKGATDQIGTGERELTDQLCRMRIQKSIGQLENPDKIRRRSRDLARVKTVLRQKRAG